MSRLLLVVRHAQSRWNAEGRWQGRADPPLSSTGEEQAQRAGAALAEAIAQGRDPGPVTSVWSSDLRRARQTAEILGAALGVTEPPRQVEDLREHDVGDWSGLTHAEIEEGWPGLIEAWGTGRLAATPGGEPRAEFDRRVRNGIRTVGASVDSGVAVVVTHGGVLRAVSRWLALPDRPVGHLAGLLLDAGHGGQIRCERPVTLLQPWPSGPDACGAAEERAGQTE